MENQAVNEVELEAHKPGLRRNDWVWLIASLIFSLGLTALSYRHFQDIERQKQAQQFVNRADYVAFELQKKIRSFEQLLRSGAAMWNLFPGVSRQQWYEFAQHINLDYNYLGVQGLGVAMRIPAQQVPAHEQQVHGEGYPEYRVNFAGKALPEYFPITYIEPFNLRNQRAFGFALNSEPVRARALQATIENAEPVLTQRTVLLQEDGKDIQFGCLYMQAFYAADLPVNTRAERQRAARGVVYVAFRGRDLVQGIFGNDQHDFALQLFTSEKPESAQMLFSDAWQELPAKQNKTELERVLEFGNQRWLMRIRENNYVDESARRANIVLIAGLLLSSLFVSLVYNFLQRQQRIDTKVKTILRQLGEKEARYSKLYDAMPEMVLEFQVNGCISGRNPAVIRFFGGILEQQGWQNLTVQQLLADITIWGWIEAELKQAKPLLQYQFICADHAGKPHSLLLNLLPTVGVNGEYLGGIALLQNVTALVSAEQKLNAIIANIVDGLIVLNDRGKIESFNKSAEHIFGYSADEVLGQNIKILMPEAMRLHHDHYIERYLAGAGVSKIGVGGRVLEGLRKNSEVFPMELAIGKIEIAGKIYFSGLVRDLTEIKKNERIKREFVAAVSHELRTPLTSIHGSLSLLVGKTFGDMPSQQFKLLQLAYRNCERLMALVNDILDVEKIASGKLRLQKQALDLIPLIKQALEQITHYADSMHIHFALVTRSQSAWVLADSHRTLQVLANLLSNSIKFSPVDGLVEIRVIGSEKYWRVEIQDQGQGIPYEFRERVFARFAQAEGGDNRRQAGAGLGLSISKDLIELMAGEIGFESEPGKGALFWFTLPVSQAEVRLEKELAPLG